jgi:predicted secreted hydrolase
MRALGWLAGLVLLLAACGGGEGTGVDAEGYRTVTGPCGLEFPRDHGAHPDHRTEWWYYTGHLDGPGGRRFGFQLTFFRHRLSPPAARRHWPVPASVWRSEQVYLAHAALSDLDGGRHFQAEAARRGALGMAAVAAEGDRVRVTLGAWEAVIGPEGHDLAMTGPDFALALRLTPEKPMVAHGQEGYSRKGRAPGQASCYYSFTRLAAEGTLTVDGRPLKVSGSAWMDHEYSTAPLEPGIRGWDWFSLQLEDRTELMFFALRSAEGSSHPASAGTAVFADGRTRALAAADVALEVRDHWESPHSGARYPAAWTLAVPSLGLVLEIEAALADQEMRTQATTGVVYWEGSVRVSGRRGTTPLGGRGYAELTGYAAPFGAPL